MDPDAFKGTPARPEQPSSTCHTRKLTRATNTEPLYPPIKKPQVDMDPDAFKGARKGKARSFAADPGLFPCDLSEGALAKVRVAGAEKAGVVSALQGF